MKFLFMQKRCSNSTLGGWHKAPGCVKSKLLSVLLFLLIQVLSHGQYLSGLAADKSFPLYTTYAAALERSQFVLDEGYHFQYYRPESGADLMTDTGGDIGLGFFMNGQWIYQTADMYRPVTIRASYPDIVVYELWPFENIKVTASFLVYSSVSAALHIAVDNMGATPASLSVIPFMRKKGVPFRNVSFINNGISFFHEEIPDGWTISHNVPYTDSIRNYFSMSGKPDDYFSFYSEAGEPFQYPFPDVKGQKAKLLLHGRVFSPGKERYQSAEQDVRMQVFPFDDDRRMITENLPVPGSNAFALSSDGYFRLEAGLLNDHRKYMLMVEDRKSGWSYNGVLTKSLIEKQRNDIYLENKQLSETVKNVQVKQLNENTRISWPGEAKGMVYDVYKRAYPDLYFEKIASGVRDHFFLDRNVPGNKITGYIVIKKDGRGNRSIHSEEVFNLPQTRFSDYTVRPGNQKNANAPFARIVGMKKNIVVPPGGQQTLAIQRTVAPLSQPETMLFSQAEEALLLQHAGFVKANERLFSQTPQLAFKDREKEALYWSCNNMMRQVFYPAEGKSSYNYYVFSREPTWGWGHGGQVFHESIAMLSYAYIDPVSAMNSQRVYRERQYPSGYINYRTGAYLDEIIEHNGQLTSSAPWYAWLNWEIYGITKDRAFLEEMYESSKKFYRFVVANRDADGDGLCEWGGEAILESVRDALVAVWDEVGYPNHFESLDLNCMLVNEAKSLEKMADELGLTNEALQWKEDYTGRSRLINSVFWDEENGFYYNVNKIDHSFTFKAKDDLKRDEIIGFLPLWAGIATPERAKRLVEKLTDTATFWRAYGVPSLSAKDPYYNPKGYWNGPVWVEWNFLVMRGLLNYGYREQAATLVNRICKGMIEVLKKDHNLWEFYSPDEAWGGYHKTYIWAGIINKMMMETDYSD